MNATQWIGAALIASPFVAMGVWTVREMGWRELCLVLGGTAAVAAVIYAGTYLLTGSVS